MSYHCGTSSTNLIVITVGENNMLSLKRTEEILLRPIEMDFQCVITTHTTDNK